jgi:hypothetical protein
MWIVLFETCQDFVAESLLIKAEIDAASDRAIRALMLTPR